MLVDTGSNFCLGNAGLFSRAEIRPTKQRIFAANGLELTVVGQTEAKILISGRAHYMRLILAEEIEGIIAGMDFLRQRDVKWNFRDDWLYIKGRRVVIHYKMQ